MRLLYSTILVLVVHSHQSPDLFTDEANPSPMNEFYDPNPPDFTASKLQSFNEIPDENPADIIFDGIDYGLTTIGGPSVLGEDEEGCSSQETPSNPLRNRKRQPLKKPVVCSVDDAPKLPTILIRPLWRTNDPTLVPLKETSELCPNVFEEPSGDLSLHNLVFCDSGQEEDRVLNPLYNAYDLKHATPCKVQPSLLKPSQRKEMNTEKVQAWADSCTSQLTLSRAVSVRG